MKGIIAFMWCMLRDMSECERGVGRRDRKQIHSSAFFRRYIDAVQNNGLQFDVVIDGGAVKPQVAYAIS